MGGDGKTDCAMVTAFAYRAFGQTRRFIKRGGSMTKYLIIAAAVLVGALIGWVLSRPKNPAADEVLVEEKSR